MSELDRLGPFVNEEGDIWVPATVGGIVAARRKANEAAMESFRFVGMEDAVMCLHEWGELSTADNPDHVKDCDLPQPCSWIGRAYHFIEVGAL